MMWPIPVNIDNMLINLDLHHGAQRDYKTDTDLLIFSSTVQLGASLSVKLSYWAV